MESKRNDKKALLLLIIIFVIFVVGIIFWGVFDYLNTNKKEGIGVFVIALIIAAFGFKMLRDKYKSVKRGEPLKDERSRKLTIKAAAYAFYIGIYWLLGMSIIIGAFKIGIPASSVPNVGIGGMAIIFGLAYWYFNKKGE
jgi:hypothetical protein